MQTTILPSYSFLQKCGELFFRQFPFCKNAENYFTVKFLSAKLQRTIFSSNSFLQKCGQLFFRQIPFCKNSDNYFTVKYVSAQMLKTIFPLKIRISTVIERYFFVDDPLNCIVKIFSTKKLN